jgi:signal transduction histidine kinase
VVAAISVSVVFFLSQWETIPFHVVWVSLSLLCCFRLWSFWVTGSVLLVVTAISGIALLYVVAGAGDAGYDELAEVPMMAAMYAVMVWGAWRREDARQELQRSSERERDFIRDASHLLRTPITIAIGHAELIRASARDTRVVDDADTVLDELRRLSVISDRLLLLHSAEDAQFLVRTPVDVRELIETTANRWMATAARDWSVSVSADGTVVGDADRLSLALDCLIENAVKATAEGDSVSIVFQADADTAAIEVSDSGGGIRKEDQERIFERFSRVHPTSAGGNGGTGLGLALVRAIAEAHHGSVEVESEPGKGAKFRIRLEGFRPRALADPRRLALRAELVSPTLGGPLPMPVESRRPTAAS